jgi:hypothetical protein
LPRSWRCGRGQALAADLPASAWQPLRRPARYQVATAPRRRPASAKQEVVRRKGYTDIRLLREEVAEFDYRPGSCARTYRVVVLPDALQLPAQLDLSLF